MALSKQTKLVVIEGPIASGKTTLLNNLNRKGFFTIKENCAEWQNFYGRNLLDCHYQDLSVKDTWRKMGQGKEEHNSLLSGTRQFQHKIISDYIKNYCLINEYNGVVLLERDLDSVRDIFMPLNRDLLTLYDYLLLSELAESAQNILNRDVAKLKIYLDVSLTEGFNRMSKRARTGENMAFNTYRKIWSAFDDYKDVCHVIVNTAGKKEKEISDEVQNIITDWVSSQPHTTFKAQIEKIREEVLSYGQKKTPETPGGKSTLNFLDSPIDFSSKNDQYDSASDEQPSSLG